MAAAVSLNHEILKEVLLECLNEKKNMVKSLTKFMLSGKEAFAVTVAYFSKSYFVRTCKNYIEIKIVEGGNDRMHTIPSHFALLKPFLKAVGNEELKIKDTTCNKIIKALSPANLRKLTLCRKANLPQKMPKMSFIKEWEIAVKGFPGKAFFDFIKQKLSNLEIIKAKFDELKMENVITLSDNGNKEYIKNFSKFHGTVEFICQLHYPAGNKFYKQTVEQPNIFVNERCVITKSVDVTENLIFKYVFKKPMARMTCHAFQYSEESAEDDS
uniref:Uncharacterized protein n=1 Tax=Panagrolaimus sp. ES5 TaxID=591445 RepID=A0AC34G3J2_9BILA